MHFDEIDKQKNLYRLLGNLLLLIGCPLLIFLGIYLWNDRRYYLVSIFIIILCFVACSVYFEKRRIKTRELVLLASLSAIATASRAAFFMLPQVKPVAALVIITGAAIHPQAGFFVGALTGFVSNFVFGQGPWTPWQMLAFGLLGFVSGLFFRGQRNKWKENQVILVVFGGFITVFLYGIIMDTASAMMFTQAPNRKQLLAMYISGFGYNLVHGISTALFLFVLGKPMFRRLDRIKRKYGMFLG